MARKLLPPPDGYVIVKSKRYGEHYRKKRGSVKKAKLNDALKLSNTHMVRANQYAKAVKDAIEPFRSPYKDGALWSRLVSLFKKQLKRLGYINLDVIRGFNCHSQIRLSRTYFRKITLSATEKNKVLEVDVLSNADVKVKWEKAEKYRQILIVVFYNGDMKPKVKSETAYFELGNEKPNKQRVSFRIPRGTIAAMAALRCDFWLMDHSVSGRGRSGLEIVEVMDLRTS